MIEYTKEELEKFMKKPYSVAIVSHFLELQEKVKKLEEENASLKVECDKYKELHNKDANSYAMKFGNLMIDFIKNVTFSEQDIHTMIEEDVTSKLSVSTDSEWVEYSGQNDHYHKTVSCWDGKEFCQLTD